LNELSGFNIAIETHFGSVDLEDFVFGFEVGDGELDLAVDSAGADEGGVETFDLVGCHDYFHFGVGIKSI
jgi:hypothetical protein